jgi:hypothetical protein
MAADSLKPLGESLTEFNKKWIVVPDILERIFARVPENKIGYRLSNTA